MDADRLSEYFFCAEKQVVESFKLLQKWMSAEQMSDFSYEKEHLCSVKMLPLQ